MKFIEAVLCSSHDTSSSNHAAHGRLSQHAIVLSPPADQEVHIDRQSERAHARCIEYADFVWLHTLPEGHVDARMAFEIGVAHAVGIPVYSLTAPADVDLAGFVTVVESIAAACALVRDERRSPPRTLDALQAYFSNLARDRGYGRETPIMALLGCVEELGELAREFSVELGAKPRLRRPPRKVDELADLLLQVVHLANRDQQNLHAAITAKVAKYPQIEGSGE